MKRVILGLILMMGGQATAQNKTVSGSFTNVVPEAISDALLIDLPLDAIFLGLGLMTNPLNLVPRTVAAVGGYAIRKTCNDYQTAEDGSKDWKISTGCGFVGGALKYSTRTVATGQFNHWEPFVGAFDAGMYEATSQVRGNWVTLELAAIEGLVSVLQFKQKIGLGQDVSKTNLAKEALWGTTVGVLVSGLVHTTVAWYGNALTNWIAKSWSDTDDSSEL